MPQMGVSVAEGTLVAWRMQPGDRVEADETICEISTDKIDTEVPAPATGVVVEILVAAARPSRSATVMARIAAGDGGGRGARGALAPAPTPAPAAPSRAPQRHRRRRRHRADAPRRDAVLAGRPADRRRARRSTSRTVTGHRAGRPGPQAGRARVVADAEPVAEPPLHIESPYRPEPVATARGPGAACGRGRRR